MSRAKAPEELEIFGETYVNVRKAQSLIKFHEETIKRETRNKRITHILIKGAFYYKIEWLKEYLNEKTKIGVYRQPKN